MRRDVGKKFDSGELIKREFPQHNGTGMQGFMLNTRRPLFQDVRVRKALDLALDFQWLNRQLFFNQYTRIDSFFANTELQAKGMPSPGELALLEPWRAKLDPAVFGLPPKQPDTDPPGSLRANLLQARALLQQAGWTYRDGALRNAKGEPFQFEILDDSGSSAQIEPIVATFIRNLQKLGITATFRASDFAVYQKRLDAFDFDTTTIRMPDVQVPGSEQIDRFGSKAADTQRFGQRDRGEVAGRRCDPERARACADARAAGRRDACARPRADAWLLCGAAVVQRYAPGGVQARPRVAEDAAAVLWRGRLDHVDVVVCTAAARTQAAASTVALNASIHSPPSHRKRRHVELHPQTPAVDDPDLARRADADLRRDPVRAGWPGRADAARAAQRRGERRAVRSAHAYRRRRAADRATQSAIRLRQTAARTLRA